MNKLKCFTLAEVLITLSILGVVAAMTIPNVISRYKEKVTVTKVKKMFTSLTDAYGQYLAENPSPSEFVAIGNGSTQIYEKIIKPYFYVKKDGGLDKSLFGDIDYYCMDGSKSCNSINVKNRQYAVELKDGGLLWFSGRASDSPEGYVAYFYYDINGTQKPNKFGEDSFAFRAINRDIYPFDDVSGISACNNVASGFGCTAWVVYRGNMDYLDCLSANWKTGFCKQK